MESGGGREKGDDEEYNQSRRRVFAHEAPALGDLGDELARTIAGSLFVVECSELLCSGILTEVHFIEAQKPRYSSSNVLGTLRGHFARDLQYSCAHNYHLRMGYVAAAVPKAAVNVTDGGAPGGRLKQYIYIASTTCVPLRTRVGVDIQNKRKNEIKAEINSNKNIPRSTGPRVARMLYLAALKCFGKSS